MCRGVGGLPGLVSFDASLLQHREALGGDTEVLAELRGQGGPVRLWAVGQRCEGGHGHRLAADAAGQGFDQLDPARTPLRSKRRSPGRHSQSLGGADHRRFAAGGGEQVEMIRAQRPPITRTLSIGRRFSKARPATQEVRPVDDQKEVAARSTGPSQPPRSQEGRWKWGRIHRS